MLDQLFPIDWDQFHFLRPMCLWLFLPLLILLLLNLFSQRQELKWKKHIAKPLQKFVIVKGSSTAKTLILMLGFLTLSFGILALSGPTWKRIKLAAQELESPLIILLDLSQSMMAEDIQPNRLERAKFKIRDLIKFNPKAKTALIGFSATAHTIVPLSKDYGIILSHLDGLNPNIMPIPGSNLNGGIILADSIIRKTNAPGTILILTDNFNVDNFRFLQEYLDNSETLIDILPLSTKNGASIPVSNSKKHFRNKDGNEIISKLDFTILEKLSSLSKVKVHQLTLDNSDVELISKKIKQNLKFMPKEKKEDWQDSGVILIIPMLILFLLWFRKGWVLYSFLILTMTSCSEVNSFNDLWYTSDYQGQMKSNDSKYEEAASLYKNHLRKGIAFYKAANYDEAISAFNKDTSAYGAYNLGIAYFKNGDTLSAILAFDKAIELNPNDTNALMNKNLIQSILSSSDELDLKKAEESQPKKSAKNVENKDMEDLGGGGQEATKEDMKKERKEETVGTDIRKGKELEEVPEDIGSSKSDGNNKVLMRKVDDDPSLFLKRKFKYQVKTIKIEPKSNEEKW